MSFIKQPRNITLNNIQLRIAVSPNCNLRCTYCEGLAGCRSDKPAAMQDFRRKPLREGNIKTEVLLDIVRLFHNEGFIGITLTGGEPLLNPEWDLIVNEAAKIGMRRIEITTNGTLLSTYLNKKSKLPRGLTLVKVSFDTPDPVRFKEITGGGNIKKVIDGVKSISPYIRTRANKVLLQSDMGGLMNYLNYCHRIGFHEVTLLDLVAYPNRYDKNEKDFFEKEYVSFSQVKDYLRIHAGLDFNTPHRYGYKATMPSGLRIFIKESGLAARNKKCLNCPVYCQEGIYTVWVGTDGNITICPDYQAELPSIDGSAELKRDTLSSKIKELVKLLTCKKQIEPFSKFLKIHGINIANKM